MNGQASFSIRGRNPDILTCIANLSNDEVFTPPEFANRMLDALATAWAANNGGAELWADSSVRFLDPFTKSGVFLREITSRLTKGLAGEIPNLQERVNHVLTKQVFGIGTTRLTSLLARRSLYCSKHADGPHSIATGAATLPDPVISCSSFANAILNSAQSLASRLTLASALRRSRSACSSGERTRSFGTILGSSARSFSNVPGSVGNSSSLS
jgi:hypothetical protein